MTSKIFSALAFSIFCSSSVFSAGNTSGGGGDPVVIPSPSDVLIFCERYGRLNDNGLAPQTISIVKHGAVLNGQQNYDVYLTTPIDKVIASGAPWNGPGEMFFLNWSGVKLSVGPWRKLSGENEFSHTYEARGGIEFNARGAVYRCSTNVDVQTEFPNCLLGEDCCPRHPTSCGGE